MPERVPRPRFFANPEKLRAWFATYHDSRDELVVGYWKRSTRRPSVTLRESVDQALCFGWIDGVAHSLDEDRYTIRFTPRRPRSRWSAKNVQRVEELTQLDLMDPAGIRAFRQRVDASSAGYSHEQDEVLRQLRRA